MIRLDYLIIDTLFLSAIPTCKAAADVGFLLDASNSLINHFSEEKHFLTSIVNAFDISKEGSRASVITFSFQAIFSIKVRKSLNLYEGGG